MANPLETNSELVESLPWSVNTTHRKSNNIQSSEKRHDDELYRRSSQSFAKIQSPTASPSSEQKWRDLSKWTADTDR